MIVSFYGKDFKGLQNNAALVVDNASYSLVRRGVDFDDLKCVCEAFTENIQPTFLIVKNDKGQYVYAALAGIPQLTKENKTEITASDIKTMLKSDIVFNLGQKWDDVNDFLTAVFSAWNKQVMGEEQSVIGQIDKDKIPVTGNSRFGCWCCTIVKEDKSLQNFINHGSNELVPLRDFRNWLVSIRQDPNFRDNKRRNGKVYKKNNGEYGFGPFKLEARQEILKRLLELQKDTGIELITMDELKYIDTLWDLEGDLSRRKLVDIYFDVYGERLPWDRYKDALYAPEIIDRIKSAAEEADIPFELITKLIVSINNNKYIARSSKMQKEFDRLINQEWIHYENIQAGLDDED